jgi:hypothetical protein
MELRKRLKFIGLNLKDFAVIIGFSNASMTNWKNRGVPIFASTLVQALEMLSMEDRKKFFAEKLGER